MTARYPLRLDLILKNVSFQVLPGQHVAVVGRTGSGKSSLVMSLFRMLETVDGNVKIDHEDVTNLPLSVHRARLNIIPQVNITLLEHNHVNKRLVLIASMLCLNFPALFL